MWCINPPVSDGNLRYRNRGPWLVLAKTSPITYKIQCHDGAEPEIVHINHLLPNQGDFGEEVHSWLKGKEPVGHMMAVTQTANRCFLKLCLRSLVVLTCKSIVIVLMTSIWWSLMAPTWRVAMRNPPLRCPPLGEVTDHIIFQIGTGQ